MIHQFVPEYLADAVRQSGLDLPGLVWLPYPVGIFGDCVAAELSDGVRLVVYAPGSEYQSQRMVFRVEDRTDEGRVDCRDLESVADAVCLMRVRATDAGIEYSRALAAFDAASSRNKSLSAALSAVGHLAPAEAEAEQ